MRKSIESKNLNIENLKKEILQKNEKLIEASRKLNYTLTQLELAKAKAKENIYNSPEKRHEPLKQKDEHYPEKEASDSLLEVHLKHLTYSSDKWESYFKHYERRLKHFQAYGELRLLEIGVQNGGSLQCWSKYFKQKAEIVGIDIDPKTSFLKYNKNYVGDAADDAWMKIFTSKEKDFNIIIDDGSHFTSDIISSFSILLGKLKPHGIYICEDLHASYWQTHNGGLESEEKHTAMKFFKELADFINREHWLELSNYSIENECPMLFNHINKYPELKRELQKITSVEFCNSLVFVTKGNAWEQLLGERIVTDGEAFVSAHI